MKIAINAAIIILLVPWPITGHTKYKMRVRDDQLCREQCFDLHNTQYTNYFNFLGKQSAEG